MQIDRRLISHFDWTLLGFTLALVLMGVGTIYSANYNIVENHAGGLPTRQLAWLGVGLVVMTAALAVDYRYLDRVAYPFYGAMVVLLFLVLFIGHSGGGSQRWINLGFFRLQPSEPAKLAVVLLMAKYLQSDEPPRGYRLRDLWASFVLVAPLVLLTLVQPDLGTAIILSLVFLSMMLMGGLRLKSFLCLVGTGLAFLPIAWHFLKPYQRQRILTFLDPDRDPLGAGYHVIQSKIAVGSGRLFGTGYLHGTQNRLDFLPAQHTDFIFAVFSEEWGFVGCFVLVGLYFLFMLYSLRLVGRAKDRFGALLAFGVLSIFFWHVVINVAMVTGMMPVVGVPLPLFSYGGSALASMMFGIGLMINVSMRRFTF
ncbi:MAG TPA: rod shape-determining protein RodA [candidate division Zixibacteria bacterium]|nr:rod shape-determining protein RodA [candidate division Zixibacteria bacterium]